MNKKFEQDYKNFIAENTPDIWARIEAGVKASQRANTPIEAPAQTPRSESTNVVKGKFTNYYQIMALAGAAACVAFLAIGSHMGSAPSGDTGSVTVAEREPVEKESSIKESGADEDSSSDASSAESASAFSVAERTEKEPKDSTAAYTGKDEKKPEEDTEKTEASSKKKDKPADPASEEKKADPAAIVTEPVTEPVTAPAEETVREGSSSSQDKESSSSRKKKKSSSSAKEEGESSSQNTGDGEVVLNLEEGVPYSEIASVEAGASSLAAAAASSSAADAAAAQAAAEAAAAQAAAEAAAAQAAAEAASSSAAQAAAEAAQTKTYNGVEVKVVSYKASGGEIIYTVKILKDESGSFKKGKKLKMVCTSGLDKGKKYIISFADDGSKTGSKPLYTILELSQKD